MIRTVWQKLTKRSLTLDSNSNINNEIHTTKRGENRKVFAPFCKLQFKIKKMNQLTEQFSNYLFWDTVKTKIDFEKNKPYVIERVLSHGMLSDWELIKKLYGKQLIKEEVLKLRYLDKYSLNFCAAYFNEPISNFRCYKLAQSNPTHWVY